MPTTQELRSAYDAATSRVRVHASVLEEAKQQRLAARDVLTSALIAERDRA